jgi:hypothetical protein
MIKVRDKISNFTYCSIDCNNYKVYPSGSIEKEILPKEECAEVVGNLIWNGNGYDLLCEEGCVVKKNITVWMDLEGAKREADSLRERLSKVDALINLVMKDKNESRTEEYNDFFVW